MTARKVELPLQSNDALPILENVYAYLEFWRKRTPTAPALIVIGQNHDRPRTLTYAELDRHTLQMANYLHEAGLRCGDRLGIFVNRDERMIVTMLAAARLGAISVPIIVPSNNCLEMLKRYCAVNPLKAIVASGLFRDFIREAFQNNVNPKNLSFEAAAVKDILLGKSSYAQNICTTRGLPQERNSGEVFYLNHTSGTSGIPKIIEATHAEVLWNASAAVEYFNLKSDSRMMCSFLFHQHELFIRPLLAGAATVVFPFNPIGQSIAAACRQGGVTHLMTNPQGAIFLAGEAPERLAKLRGLLQIIEIGGGIVSEDVSAFLEDKTGARCIPVYGATELSGIGLARPLSLSFPYNVLRPIGTYKADLRPCSNNSRADHVGELVISGPAVATGYFNASPSGSILSARHFYTGDLAVQTDEGFKVLGRIDHCIKILGKLQPVEEIELELKKRLREKILCVQVVDFEAPEKDLLTKAFGTGLLAVLRLNSEASLNRADLRKIRRMMRKATLIAGLQAPGYFVIAENSEVKFEGGKLIRRAARQTFPYAASDWQSEDRGRVIRTGFSFIQWLRLFIHLFNERKAVARPLEAAMRIGNQIMKNALTRQPASVRESGENGSCDAVRQENGRLG